MLSVLTVRAAPIPLDLKIDVLNRGRRSVALNLKTPEGIATAFALIARADAVIEGYRPGVMERLGLGPENVWRRTRVWCTDG